MSEGRDQLIAPAPSRDRRLPSWDEVTHTEVQARTGVLDFDALSEASLRDIPFRWTVIPRAVQEPAAAALLAHFPTGAFWLIDGDDGEKRYSYAARPLVTLGADHAVDSPDLEPVWHVLAAELLSSRYREWLAGLIGTSLDEALMEASIWRWDAGHRLEPHRDMKEKIATQVFYFSDHWERAWGGGLRILASANPEDTYADLMPENGSSSVLVRSDNSWHAVTPVTASAAQPRRSVIVTWFHRGSRSPVWSVNADGEVNCTASQHREPVQEQAAMLHERVDGLTAQFEAARAEQAAFAVANKEAEERIAEVRLQLQHANERIAALEAIARRRSVRLALGGADRLAQVIKRIQSQRPAP